MIIPIIVILSVTQAMTDQENDIVSRHHYFDSDILGTFGNEDNYFISPASIKITLAMILEGAKGRCAEEIATALRLPVNPDNSREQLRNISYDLSSKSEPTILESANAAYVSNLFHVEPEYTRNLEQFYKTPVQSLNFADSGTAAKLMNNWASNAMRGMNTEIVNSANINSDTGLVIANALYFKGTWKNEFDTRNTRIQCFRTLRECVHIAMMQIIDNCRYKFIEDLNAQAVELPYSGGEYAMLILVPSEKNSADNLQRDLHHILFTSIIDKLKASDVVIHLPKFEIESNNSDLVATLQMLGIVDIFNSRANLSGIVTQSQGQLKVSNIIHKTRIEVNEKGSKAVPHSIIDNPLINFSRAHIIADRPFLFFIYQASSERLNTPPVIGNQSNQDPLHFVNHGLRYNDQNFNQRSFQQSLSRTTFKFKTACMVSSLPNGGGQLLYYEPQQISKLSTATQKFRHTGSVLNQRKGSSGRQITVFTNNNQGCVLAQVVSLQKETFDELRIH